MSVEPWKRRSAFHTDSPWRAQQEPHAAPWPRPRGAQAGQRLVAAEQREHVEQRRRRRAARHGQPRELGEVDELEAERRGQVAVERLDAPAP